MAGVEVVGAVDIWDLARASYLDNFPNAKFYNRRCESLRPQSIQKEIGAIDVLLASPECTSHTCAKGASPRSEKSRATAFEVLRYARIFKPRWIVVENVVHMRSWRRFRSWLSSLGALGYKIRTQVLNAADFGVAQTRRRLFVMADGQRMPPLVRPINASRIPVAELITSDTELRYSPLRKKGRAKPTLVRAQRAIKSLGARKPFLIVYYGSDGAGGWQRIDRPLRTITTVDRFAYVRPTKNGHELRMLQVPELKAAMGFPDEHKISQGTRRDRIKLIGNAVCPPVVKAVIENLTADSR